MKTAISARLDDLIAAAGRLQRLIDHEDPAAPLPAFSLCRAAIDVDKAVNVLEQHCERLSAGQGPEAGENTAVGLPWSSAVPR